MRRVYGFLVLGLVVLAGVLWVEADNPGSANAGGGSVYRVILGGRADVSTDPPSTDPPSTVGNPAPTAGRDGIGDSRPQNVAGAPSSEAPAAGSERMEPQQPPSEYSHTVRSGEVLGSILIAYLGSASNDRIERVCRRNQLRDANQIRLGDLLHIPVTFVRHVADGEETVQDIARTELGSARRVEALLKANPWLQPSAGARIPRDQVIWIPR